VKSRFGKPARGRLGWRGLLYCWTVILTGGIAGAALLQAIGPPPKGSEHPMAGQRPSGDVAVPSAPAQPGRAGQPASSAFARPEMPRNDEIAVLLESVKVQLVEGHIDRPPGDNARETLERVSAVFLRASPADLQRIIDVKLRLYERAQARAGAGNFDEANRILALAAKLPMNLLANGASMPDQTTPDRGATIAHGLPLETEGNASLPEANASAIHSGPSPSITASETIARDRVAAKASLLGPRNIGAQRIASLSLSIHFAANQPLAEAETRRLTARLGARFDHADMHSETDMPSTAIIRYFSAPDHSAAREVGRLLGEMGYPWHIESPLTDRPTSSPGSVEVWIPNAVHRN
jgi:hypothetical protein